jgi:hypothetical protein
MLNFGAARKNTVRPFDCGNVCLAQDTAERAQHTVEHEPPP